MRKILLLILLFLFMGFYIVHSMAATKIDLKLEEEIGIVFINNNMLLILDKEDATLLVLGKGEIKSLSKFNYDKLNILQLKENAIDVKGNNQVVLEGSYTINDVNYYLENGLIYVNYKNTNVCIFTGGEYNISNCQFVYFHDTKINEATVYDYNEVILYYYKNPLPTNILEEIYEQSVDTYQIRDDELTIIKISDDDYDFIVIDTEE